MALNGALIVCRPLLDWFRKKHCIYDIVKLDENLCVWRCLTIYKRLTRGETNQVSKRNCDAAKNLACKYYGDKKLKKRVVSPKKSVDVEGIVYGKIQQKKDLPTLNMGLLGIYCFYMKKMDIVCKRCDSKGCRQIIMGNEDLTKCLKDERSQEEKQKLSVQVVNSSIS